MKTLTDKKIRRGVAVLAFAGAAVVGGSGIADAQSDTDYPPEPTVPTSEVPPVVSPDSPTSQTDTDSGTTLPQTGGPGTTQILLIAGAAVAAGVAVTGVSSRRRNDDLNAA